MPARGADIWGMAALQRQRAERPNAGFRGVNGPCLMRENRGLNAGLQNQCKRGSGGPRTTEQGKAYRGCGYAVEGCACG